MPVLNVARETHGRDAPPGVRVMLCFFSVLERWEHDDLSAPFWRWYWNDRAGASVVVDGRAIALTPGRIVLIPPNTPFATDARRPVGHLYVHFWVGLTRAATAARVIVRRPDAAELRQVRGLVDTLRADPASPSAGLRAQSLAARALADLPATDWTAGPPDAAVERALRRLHDDLPRPPSNAGLAADAGLGVNTLLRRFRAATGTSPHQYALRLRIERACDLLRNTDASIEQVAERTAFCDRFHLSRTFRAHLGMGPAAFRARQRG